MWCLNITPCCFIKFFLLIITDSRFMFYIAVKKWKVDLRLLQSIFVSTTKYLMYNLRIHTWILLKDSTGCITKWPLSVYKYCPMHEAFLLSCGPQLQPVVIWVVVALMCYPTSLHNLIPDIKKNNDQQDYPLLTLNQQFVKRFDQPVWSQKTHFSLPKSL